MALTRTTPGVSIAVFELAVFIDGCILAIDSADDINPLSGSDRLLKIAPNAFSSCQIEHIKANAIRSGWIVCGLLVIYPEDPFALTRFTFAQPMNIACAFRDREGQYIWSDPRWNR